MDKQTDQQLLRDYARLKSDAAFAELVRRHVDIVYSAALRMVRDTHLAEDVTQAVFLGLAQNASKLTDRAILSGWLHRATQNLAANVVRSDVRRRAREQEAATMNDLLAGESGTDWKQIAPQLDAALSELTDTDRDAVLMRYFERKSAREMAAILGGSEEAAQKRVARAVERLRELFTKRGVALGAGGLVTVISSNAVQAAPAGLVTTIASAVSLTGTALATSTAAVATKTIAMTTLQKTLVTVAIAAAIGTGIYEARDAATLRNRVQSLQQQQAPLAGQIQRLERERDDATNRLALLSGEIGVLRSNSSELLKLRSQATQFQAMQQQLAKSGASGLDPNDPSVQHFLEARATAQEIGRYLDQMPEKKIPELKLLTDEDWLAAAKTAKFDTDANIRKTLSQLRSAAKGHMFMGSTLFSYTHANNGQLPTDISQLKPLFGSRLQEHGFSVDAPTLDAIFARYTLLHTGNVSDLPPDTWIIVEKAPVDKDYDSRAKFGLGKSTIIATGLGEAGDPDDKSY